MSDSPAVAARFDGLAASYDDNGVHRWLAEQVAHFATDQLAAEQRATGRLATEQLVPGHLAAGQLVLGQLAAGHLGATIPARLVLDVATGTGLVIEAMIATGSTAYFAGVDISAGMLAEAARKRHADQFGLSLADGNRLPFADNTFDLTTCVSAMPYFLDPAHAMAEWRRVTRGGRIIFTAWADGGLTLPRLVRQAAAEVGVRLPDPNAALASAEGIRAIAERAGLYVARIAFGEYREPLREADALAWPRVIGAEHGAVMRAASPSTQVEARDRFHRLLATAISNGEPNWSRAHLVEATTPPRSRVPSSI